MSASGQASHARSCFRTISTSGKRPKSFFDSDPDPDELPESISADKVTVAQPAILTEQGPLNSAGIGQGSDASPVDSPC